MVSSSPQRTFFSHFHWSINRLKLFTQQERGTTFFQKQSLFSVYKIYMQSQFWKLEVQNQDASGVGIW